jgi:hypothetical protein
VTVDAPDASGNSLRVALPASFARSARIDGVTPDPASTALGDDATTYEWTVSDWDAPVRVVIRYEPDDLGPVSGDLRVTAGADDERAISLDQFVLP